jgi:predicted cobalt transporter CbtA
MTVSAINGSYFWWVIALIVLAFGLTIYVFRRRMFERGYQKSVAAQPCKVRRENPPDRVR